MGARESKIRNETDRERGGGEGDRDRVRLKEKGVVEIRGLTEKHPSTRDGDGGLRMNATSARGYQRDRRCLYDSPTKNVRAKKAKKVN